MKAQVVHTEPPLTLSKREGKHEKGLGQGSIPQGEEPVASRFVEVSNSRSIYISWVSRSLRPAAARSKPSCLHSQQCETMLH